MLAADLSIRGHSPEIPRVVIEKEVLYILAIGGVVIIAEDWKAQFSGGQPGFQPGAVFTATPLRLIGEIGFHLLVYTRGNIYNSIDQLRPSRKIVFFLNAVRL
jgi:hypothetical protein